MQISHPGMTRQFLDAAFHRAMLADISLSKTSRPGVFAVSSTQDDDLYYLVSRTECSCSGHRSVGRCLHRAMVCVWLDVMRHVELGAARYADDPQTAA